MAECENKCCERDPGICDCKPINPNFHPEPTIKAPCCFRIDVEGIVNDDVCYTCQHCDLDNRTYFVKRDNTHQCTWSGKLCTEGNLKTCLCTNEFGQQPNPNAPSNPCNRISILIHHDLEADDYKLTIEYPMVGRVPIPGQNSELVKQVVRSVEKHYPLDFDFETLDNEDIPAVVEIQPNGVRWICNYLNIRFKITAILDWEEDEFWHEDEKCDRGIHCIPVIHPPVCSTQQGSKCFGDKWPSQIAITIPDTWVVKGGSPFQNPDCLDCSDYTGTFILTEADRGVAGNYNSAFCQTYQYKFDGPCGRKADLFCELNIVNNNTGNLICNFTIGLIEALHPLPGFGKIAISWHYEFYRGPGFCLPGCKCLEIGTVSVPHFASTGLINCYWSGNNGFCVKCGDPITVEFIP